ncbi:MAG: hypothetical protein LC658_14830, partial [Bacteroidales bacterium]|nr:hypothetical protein [Bacteroidales bacterium]
HVCNTTKITCKSVILVLSGFYFSLLKLFLYEILDYGARVEREATFAAVDEDENAKGRKLFEGEKPG